MDTVQMALVPPFSRYQRGCPELRKPDDSSASRRGALWCAAAIADPPASQQPTSLGSELG